MRIADRVILRLVRWREQKFRRRMREMRVMYPADGDSVRSLAPKPRCVVRQFGPRPR